MWRCSGGERCGHGEACDLHFLDIRYFHITCNTPCLSPKILHSLFFPFLLGITVVPRETKDNAHATFWEANEVYCGGCGNGE